MTPAPAAEPSSFGDLLRRFRGGAGLTQEQLAERARLSADAIGLLERGLRRAPRAATVQLLTQALALKAADRDALLVAARRARPAAPGVGIAPEPTPHFVGRRAELAELRGLLRRSSRVAVIGLGGMGKTQLVARHVQRHRADYPDGVFWLRGDREDSLVGDLAGLAWRLGLAERQVPEQERQVEAVLRWLREHPNWVVVIDNVELATREAVGRWLPSGLPGRLVLTSRTPMWPVQLVLESLDPEAARTFLLRRTRQRDAEAADAVAEALGWLPLALAQAAAYADVTGRDLASYAALLRTRLVELMSAASPEDYPRPVATTWELSLEHLECDHPGAAALLRLCAFLAPDDIPVGVLQLGAGHLPADLGSLLRDELGLDRAVAALRRCSLLVRHGDDLRVHRLVQAVVRESLDAGQRRHWLATSIRLLAATFPGDPAGHPEDWPFCARMVAHAQVADLLAGDEPVEAAALGDLVNRVGLYLWARAELVSAGAMLERARAIRERGFGPDHASTAQSTNDLGVVRLHQGDLAVARTLHERALAARERTLGSDHPDTTESINNLAVVLRDQGDLVAARGLYERALAIQERVMGREDLAVSFSCNNLAIVLQRQGELAAARSVHERALSIRRRRCGPEHRLVADSLNNLAYLFREMGDLASAQSLNQRALGIYRRVLGPDHPYTARSLHTLARVLADRGHGSAARILHERALSTFERSLGPGHRWTADCRRALAALE